LISFHTDSQYGDRLLLPVISLAQSNLTYHTQTLMGFNPNVDLVANPEEEFIGFTSNVIDRKVNASFPDTPLEFWSG